MSAIALSLIAAVIIPAMIGRLASFILYRGGPDLKGPTIEVKPHNHLRK